ncbi:MAG TPA: UDP-3-O-(3-hydroxymyristoyl)glucosamine N-acyltransferase [Tepidisphaeraceae bacterium]|nr:UDP-3-O-(3-hydroxymyristoyl)glucosamine N-acyltransferase [Tepidisphaeraceae bacterium]
MKLKELAKWIGAEVVGDPSIDVTSANTLDEAGPGQVSFLANRKYAKQLESTHASAVIVGLTVTSSNSQVALLKTQDPYYAFTQAIVILHGHRKHPHQGIHPKAHVDPTATVGEGTVIYPGCYVGPRAKIGRDCILYPNVVVYDDCILGDRVTIHAGTVIGNDGFGYATQKGVHHKIPQVGNVIVEDDVEIGANCAIERATLGSTIVGKGNKWCDLVAIGHGTKVGPHGLLVAQVGVAGSTTIGHHATIAGQVGIAGHLKIGDNVTIGAQTGVMDDVPDQTTVIGTPAMPASHARRVYLLFMQLPDVVDRLRKLEQAIGELGSNPDEPEKA